MTRLVAVLTVLLVLGVAAVLQARTAGGPALSVVAAPPEVAPPVEAQPV